MTFTHSDASVSRMRSVVRRQRAVVEGDDHLMILQRQRVLVLNIADARERRRIDREGAAGAKRIGIARALWLNGCLYRGLSRRRRNRRSGGWCRSGLSRRCNRGRGRRHGGMLGKRRNGWSGSRAHRRAASSAAAGTMARKQAANNERRKTHRHRAPRSSNRATERGSPNWSGSQAIKFNINLTLTNLSGPQLKDRADFRLGAAKKGHFHLRMAHFPAETT